MVRASPRRGGRVLLPGLLGLCLCGAFLAFGSLPALAAEPCPPAGLVIEEEMPQPEREIRALRNDGREFCSVEIERFAIVVARLEGVEAVLSTLHGDLVTLHGDLSASEGLPVRSESQSGPVQVEAPAGVLVTNPTDVEPVQQAVVENSETLDSNLWAIAGLVAGFALLAVVYKLVRP
jgi:hypothetical protein